jgi:hypothetical protein
MAGGVSMSASHNPFLYETIMEDPKKPRDLFKVDDNTEYEVLHNNGFLRINTLRCRMYHIYQARYGYQLPDWKIHFSVARDDLPKAWNILSTLFMERKCQSAMKVVVADYGKLTWPEDMRGREITVYIYQHKKYYDEVEEYAPIPQMQQSREFWLSFIAAAEARLAVQKIKPLPPPDGDYPLGTYSSLRNEAFTLMLPKWENKIAKSNLAKFDDRQYCYPPNDAGWNAAGHKNPLINPLLAFLAQPIQQKLQRRAGKQKLAEMHDEFKAVHSEMKTMSAQPRAVKKLPQPINIALAKPETSDGEIRQSDAPPSQLNALSTTVFTATSSSFFATAASSASTSVPAASKDESITALAAKMSLTLKDPASARAFLSSLTAETYELLKTAVQEKEFEDDMQAAIRSYGSNQ